MRILVAEDDPVTSKIVESTLKRLGWDVITAADGSAAWKILEELKGGKRARPAGDRLDDAGDGRDRDLPQDPQHARFRADVRHSAHVA